MNNIVLHISKEGTNIYDIYLEYLITGLIFIILIKIVSTHNNFIKKSNSVKESLAGIQVQLRKKIDLIPSLAKIVTSYNIYESNLLSNLVKLRENAKISDNAKELLKENNNTSDMLKNLSLKLEAYPELQASTQYQKLQESLNEIEKNIAASRRIYNESVNNYNNYINIFPNNILRTIEKKKNFDFFNENVNLEEEAKSIKLDI